MPNVVRFTLPAARSLYVRGAGQFVAGVLDVDANDLDLVSRTRYLVRPYGVVEVGIVDSAAPKPSLPAVPAAPSPDPYPQYPTMDEILASPDLRAAFGLGANITDLGVAAFVGTEGTQTRGVLHGLLNGRTQALPALVDPDRYIAPNAAVPLTTPTYDGTGAALHPSVVNVQSSWLGRLHGMTEWNGYRYWMAHTPYANRVVELENPSLLVSNDGQTWINAPGVSNPLVPVPPEGGGSFNNDPELEFGRDADGNIRLYMFWRTNAGAAVTTLHGFAMPAAGGEALFVRSSADGVNWSAYTLLLTAAPPGTGGNLSPTVVYDPGADSWTMWVVNRNTPGAYQMRRRVAVRAEGPWPINGDACTFPLPAPLTAGWREPWHSSVIQHGGVFYAVMNDTQRAQNGVGGDLYFGVSADGLTWRTSRQPITGRRADQWDTALYRATLQPAIINGELGFEMWYSNQGTGPTTQRIGYSQIVRGERDRPKGSATPVADILAATRRYEPFTLGDDARRVDGAIGTATSGQVWTVNAGALNIAGNRIKAPTAVNSRGMIDGGLVDGEFSVEIERTIADDAWIVVRGTDGTAYQRIGFPVDSNVLTFQRIAPSQSTADVALATVTASKLRLTVVVREDIYTVFVDGRFVGGFASTANLTGTLIGVQTARTGSAFRNLTARALTGGR